MNVLNGLGDRLPDIDYVIVELLDAGRRMSSGTVAVIELLRAAGCVLTTVTGFPWEEELALPENNLLASRQDTSTRERSA